MVIDSAARLLRCTSQLVSIESQRCPGPKRSSTRAVMQVGQVFRLELVEFFVICRPACSTPL